MHADKTQLPFVPSFRLGKFAFLVYSTALSVGSSFLLYSLASHETNEQSLIEGIARVVSAFAIAPGLETVLFQLAPYLLAAKFQLRPTLRFLLMSVPFALVHYANGILAIMDALVGGIILALTFLVWAREGIRCSIWMTVAVHTFHNVSWLLLLVALPSVR